MSVQSWIVRLGLAAVSTLIPAKGKANKMDPQTFLERYRTQVPALTSPYEQVHMVALVTETFPLRSDKKNVYELELLQDGPRFKVLTHHVSGDWRGTRSIRVANPDISFVLDQPADRQQYAINYLSSRRGLGFDQIREEAVSESMLLRSHYSYFEKPLTVFLTMKSTSIQEVQEETSAGRSLVRVRVRFGPFTEWLRKQGIEYSEGWFLFEPSARWLFHGFDLKEWKKDGQMLTRKTSSVEYTEAIQGVPVLRRAKYEVFDHEGHHALEYDADVKSVQFGPVSVEEFTLRGCGITGIDLGDRRGLPVIFYWSAGIALLAVIAIFVLRRRPSERPSAERPR
jgi:hypothetical protein